MACIHACPPRKRQMQTANMGGSSDAAAPPFASLRNSQLFADIGSFSRVRRYFSDPGAGIHRPLCSVAAGWPQQQRQQASGVGLAAASGWLAAAGTTSPSSPSSSAAGADDAGSPTLSGSRSTCSKRERESSEGCDDSSCPTSPGSDGGDRSGVVWLKLSQLARRNRMLEQQLAERMQATHLSGTKQPPSAVQQHLSAAAAGRSAVAMEVDCRSSGKPKDPVAIIDCRPLPHPSQPVQQQQQQQRGQQDSSQQQEVQRLRREVQRLQGLNTMLQNDNADLELVLKETEKQRREFAARFAFMTLDTDTDGYVSVAQVEGYELFSCYAPSLLRSVFALWRYDSAYANFLTIDDFVRFVDFSEDRTTREAHEFWFRVLDADGDNRLNWLDCRQAYDAVDTSLAAGGGVIAFEDLMCQLRDMVPCQARPEDGFTLQELWDSKLGGGVLGLLTNANNMLLQRSTAEWNRGDFPL